MLETVLHSLVSQPRRWLLAGLVASVVLAIFMEGIAPFAIGGPLKPALLICQLFGWDTSLLWLAEIIHYALGLIAFPFGFVVLRETVGLGTAVIAGTVWGAILWAGAGAVIAPLAGQAFFFGAGQVMMASLVAHLAYGLVLGAVYGQMRPATE